MVGASIGKEIGYFQTWLQQMSTKLFASGGYSAYADKEKGKAAMKWRKFSTHVQMSNNKYKANRYVKVNGQSIYNGSVGRYNRATIKSELSRNMSPGLLLMKEAMFKEGLSLVDSSISVKLYFGANAGYGDVKMRKTKEGLRILSGDECKNIRYDLDNQWIWGKVFLDELQAKGIVRNDTADRIFKNTIEHVPVDSFSDRFLMFVLTQRR